MMINKSYSKGFVTIATGDLYYYQLAYTLLQSFKQKSLGNYPFAILCDKENEYTAHFDQVILLPDAKKNYLDKIDLLINCPFDETIFIDADCIVYNDLSVYWDIFADATDFSCFGEVLPLNQPSRSWFDGEKLQKVFPGLSYNISMHGGIYFIRQGEKCQNIHAECYKILDEYDKYSFSRFKKPADEPILALAMAIHHCRPVYSGGLAYVWLKRAQYLKVDYFKNYLVQKLNGHIVDSIPLLHFGTVNTKCFLYQVEKNKVSFDFRYGRPWRNVESIIYYIKSAIKGFPMDLALIVYKAIKQIIN